MPIPIPTTPDPSTLATVGYVFSACGLAGIIAAIVPAIPSSRAARVAARKLDLEKRQAEEKSSADMRAELRADLERVIGERDRAEAERDRQRTRAEEAEHALHMRLAGCERQGNLCLVILTGPTGPAPIPATSSTNPCDHHEP